MSKSKMINRRNHRSGERGQVLVLCAVCILVLMLFVGLAISFGFAYVTKARLGKAADAAALVGARYSAKGSTVAGALAQSAFALNYPTSSTPPVVNVVYSTDANGNTLVNVTSTATIATSFLGMLGDSTMNVTSYAQSKAQRVALTLVLDRTGSMGPDGGMAALPGAVTSFINYFDNNLDSAALISFANDVTVNVPMMTGGFQQPIINAATAMTANGNTWSEGALTQALATETAFVPPAATNPQKVVVFFTDGNANTVKDTVSCGGGTAGSGTWNMGGYDVQAYGVAFLHPDVVTNPTCSETGTNCCQPLSGQTAAYFNSHVAGGPMPINWLDISGPNGDARFRAIALANSMRAVGITVYAIGLGSATEPVNPGFICQIANDPSPACAAFAPNLNLPMGIGQWVATGGELDQAFQTLAEEIRLRLTQ
jgi:Flp pilus assembly protein TadG